MIDPVRKNEYISFLDRNYCITSHVIERLEELENGFAANFTRELHATVASLSSHLKKADAHYKTIGAVNSFADNEPLVAWLESLFSGVQTADGHLSAIALLDYLAVADRLLEQSAKLAQLACAQTPEFSEFELYNINLLNPVIGLLENQAVGV